MLMNKVDEKSNWLARFQFCAILIATVCISSGALSSSQVKAQAPTSIPKFRAQTIDSKVIIGYGVAIGDVNGDSKPDILLADKKQFVWYENPNWDRHVIAEDLTERDNVCIAARDIDGDGKVEVAVGGQWNPGDTVNSGAVYYLKAPADRTKRWTPIKLHHEPVVHRMRWVRIAKDQFRLVVAPLHGRGNKKNAGNGVRLLAYEVPNDPTQGSNWKTELLDDEFHVTHNFDIGQWNATTEPEEILYLGKEGAKLISFDGNRWQSKKLPNVQGGGEIRMGQSDTAKFLANIEPFHGTELVVYPYEDSTNAFAKRIVIDKQFNQGHAVATGNLFGNGTQIVAGWRKPNDDGKFGIKLYYQTSNPQSSKPQANSTANASTTAWLSFVIDENEMACEDLRLADLNDDGRLDIIASGRSTHNLKIYWNEGE